VGAGAEREFAMFRDLRERALKYRCYLEVQREALGIRRRDTLDECYKVPRVDSLE